MRLELQESSGRPRRTLRPLRGRSLERLESRDLLALMVGPIFPTEGQLFQGKVASFSAADVPAPAIDTTAAIVWGDGTMSTGKVVADPQGGFDVTGSKTYPRFGRFPITVTLNPPGAVTASAQGQGLALVTDAPLILTGTKYTASAGRPFVGTVATFQDTDPSSAGDFTATIQWGSGESTTLGTITPLNPTGPSIAPGKSYAVSGPYAYGTPGNVTATITLVRTSTGQTVTAMSSGTILAPSTAFPTLSGSLVGSGLSITTTAGQSFSGPVAVFTDTMNTGKNPGAYNVSIAWGDGHVTPGITVYDKPSESFYVFGSNTYAGSGTYPVTVSIQPNSGGAASVLLGRAMVTSFTGMLDPLSDSGPSNSDGITNKNQPTLIGRVEPDAIVRVFAQRSDSNQVVPIGETIAGSSGVWSLKSLPLADGTYTITGEVVPTTGSPALPQVLTKIQIDTIAPRVVGVTYDATTGTATLSVRDDRSGLNLDALGHESNYALFGPGITRTRATLATRVEVVAPLPSDPRPVVLSFNLSPKHRSGNHTLRIAPGSLTDLAGNGLVAELFHVVTTRAKAHPLPSAHSSTKHGRGR